MILEREFHQTEFELSEEDWQIIEQRRSDFLAGKVKAIPAKKAIADIRKKLKRAS